MGYYVDGPPRHGHRTPSELAEDEKLAALHGTNCVATARLNENAPQNDMACRHPAHRSLLSWADAHPLAALVATQRIKTPSFTDTIALSSVGPFRQLFRPGRQFRVLLALQNDDNARAAIRLTAALMSRGAIPTVINVVDVMEAVPAPTETIFLYSEGVLSPEFHEERRRFLGELIAREAGGDQQWPITSVVGTAVPWILSEAKAQLSDLIVMGIHRHGPFEQAVGENSATRVMGQALIPLLGVRPGLTDIPKRVMVATDFGDASREAAHIAANLVNPGGTVILVHAHLPSPIVEEGDEGAALVQREGIEHAFLHLADEISKGKSITTESIARAGDPATQLMDAATLILPDVIAIASQRHHIVTRLLLGSVTRKLTREGSWSMLITPPVGAAGGRASS